MKLFPDVRIGDIADVRGGKCLPKGTSVKNKPTAYPYLRIVDFDEYGINKSNIKFIEEQVQQQISRYRIYEQDIYISIAGTIGRVGIPKSEDRQVNLTLIQQLQPVPTDLRLTSASAMAKSSNFLQFVGIYVHNAVYQGCISGDSVAAAPSAVTESMQPM